MRHIMSAKKSEETMIVSRKLWKLRKEDLGGWLFVAK